MRKKANHLPVRQDHYDGQSALYRLSAKMNLENRITNVSKENMVNKLINSSSKWSVIPNELVLFSDTMEIHWYAKEYQMVSNRKEYTLLIQNFLDFIHGIPDVEILFLDRCLTEDPDRSMWSVPNELVNFNPKFNSDCFGSKDGDINVLDLCEWRENFYGTKEGSKTTKSPRSKKP
jgi:hypothetical protein